jgi:MFS transporter, DHA2 family, methylenomycin A resistance protein
MPSTETDALPLPGGAVPARRDASPAPKLLALATGFIMAALDVTIVNVAGAAIQEHLHASLAELTWTTGSGCPASPTTG